MKIKTTERKNGYKLLLVNGSGKNRLHKTLPVSSDSKAELEFMAERMNKEIVRKSINTIDDFYEVFTNLNVTAINDVLSKKENSFVEYITDVVENKHEIKAISDKTYLDYTGIIKNHFTPFFKGIKIKSLNKSLIKNYIAEKSANFSRGTLDVHLKLIRIAVKNAIDDDILTKDITANIERPKAVKKEKNIYSSEEILNLLKLLEESDKKDLYIQVLLAATLGLRNAEILGLCWDCVDFNNNIIEVKRITTKDEDGKTILAERTKTATSTRKIQGSKELFKAMKEYKKISLSKKVTSNLLFHTNGNPIVESSLSVQFSRFLKSNNLPKTRLHDLRHYFASQLINSNVPITVVSKYLGHSNTNVTASVYAHVLNNANETSGDVISQAIFG